MMERLTTDTPSNNIEALLNYAYAKNMRVKLRGDDGEDRDLAEYVAELAKAKGCDMSDEDVMEGSCCMECDCELAVLNVLAIQAAELRHRLKQYEDLEEQGRLAVLPCKIGDYVFGIRTYNHGGTRVKEGVVKSMHFGDDMRLCIAVKNVCTGEWGRNIFGTYEEAVHALAGGDY